MCRLSWNLGASISWNPQGLSRSVMGLLYLYIYIYIYTYLYIPTGNSIFRICYPASPIQHMKLKWHKGGTVSGTAWDCEWHRVLHCGACKAALQSWFCRRLWKNDSSYIFLTVSSLFVKMRDITKSRTTRAKYKVPRKWNSLGKINRGLFEGTLHSPVQKKCGKPQ
jgi:hypothetical protein